MTTSKIEWTDRSDWNPIRGCTRVSPGCGGPGDHGGCYAEAMAARFSKPGLWGHGFAEMKNGKPRWTGKVALAEERVTLPLTWKKPAKVFVSSTSDVFHESLPDEAIDRIFAVMALCPHLTFQILTKRPERMRAYMSGERDRAIARRCVDLVIEMKVHHDNHWPVESIGDIDNPTDLKLRLWPLPNVWLGTSVEDQPRADERIPHLLAAAAAIRFISFEPLLGPVDCDSIKLDGGERIVSAFSGLYGFRDSESYEASGLGPKIDWAITGGESGPRARPMHPDWVRALRDQCGAAGVPFFFKQWGEWLPTKADDHPRPCAHTPAALNASGQIEHQPSEAFKHMALDEAGWAGMCRLGRNLAGRTLDGREWSEFPQVPA